MVKNPPFYLHKTQLQDYCQEAQQHIDMVFQQHDLTSEVWQQHETNWSEKIGRPLLDFLSTLPEESLVSEVNDELVINLEEPGKREEIENDVLETDMTYLDYLSNTQQDDLLRKFILQERTAVPDPKCDDCSNISCKKCQVMKNHKSYSAYLAYQRMLKI